MTDAATSKSSAVAADGGGKPTRQKPGAETWSYDFVAHPNLPLVVLCDADRRLVAVEFGGDLSRLAAFAAEHEAAFEPASRGAGATTALAVRELTAYLAGQLQTFTLPLRLIGSSFQQRVWHALLAIPFGEVQSYGELARGLDRSQGARAVGGAAGRNPIPVVVPCHRLVAAGGALGGFSGGLDNKRWLLDHEARHAPTGGKRQAVQLEL